ncbi:MAG: hypothetical protein NT058_01700 [Candidatus Portnoybacteria bacterium]|nr:hypothetical protein [Candidatus Portnoybacteria bacterium]
MLSLAYFYSDGSDESKEIGRLLKENGIPYLDVGPGLRGPNEKHGKFPRIEWGLGQWSGLEEVKEFIKKNGLTVIMEANMKASTERSRERHGWWW